jgi:hypothetical protein
MKAGRKRVYVAPVVGMVWVAMEDVVAQTLYVVTPSAQGFELEAWGNPVDADIEWGIWQ